MAFVDDFIANLAKDFRQIPNQAASNLNSVATGIAGALIGNGLNPTQLLLVAQQAIIGFATGETAADFPGRVNTLVGAAVSIAPLLAFSASFGEVNIGFILYSAGYAVSGSAIVATTSTLLVPIAAGIVFGTVAQAYAETLQSYSNGGAGYQLTTPTEQAGFSLIGLQYDADLALAATPDATAVSSIITPGSVLTINLDPTLWHSTYSGNPPEGYGVNEITGRTVLIQGILGALNGTDGSELLSVIHGSLDPYVTEILVANVSGVAISDAGVATAFGQSYGEAFILGNTSGSILTPTGNTFDAFLAQGQSNTIDFTSSVVNGNGANLVELVNGGTLTIQAADSADCTVIWDTSGNGTIAINNTSGGSAVVVEVDVPDAAKASFLALNAAQLDALFGAAIVIVNPTANEHITFNGVQLNTPDVVNVPNPVYNPDLFNRGEPNSNLTPYFVDWLTGGLEYTAGSIDSEPGDSYVTVATRTDNSQSLTLFGFANGDFGFSVPSSRTTFDLFTGVPGSLPTKMNGHAQLTAANYLAFNSNHAGNTATSPTAFGGANHGTVDPNGGVLEADGTITSSNTYSWLASFVSLSAGDFDAPDGAFTFDTTNGHWTFTLDESSPQFLSLKPGSTALDRLTVHTIDGSSDVISVTVVAANNSSKTVNQFLADQSQIDLPGITITITDTAANISAAFDALNADTHVTSITIGGAGGQVLTLSVAQALGDPRALGLITNANYLIAIADSAANVAAALTALSSNPLITSITLTGQGPAALSLAVSQALAGLHALGLITSPHMLTITDTAVDLRALTPAQIGALAADGLTLVVATDAAANFNAAQKQALGAAGVKFAEPYSNGQLATWTLNGDGSTHDILYTNVTGQKWDATDAFYGANGRVASEVWTAGGALVQTQNWNGDGSVHDRHYYQVTGQTYTDYDVLYGTGALTGLAVSETFSNGMVETLSYTGAGALSEILYTGATGQPWDRNDTLYGAGGKPVSETWTTAGALYRTENWNADGSIHDIHYYQVTGQSYTDYDVVYGANGKEAQRVFSNGEVISETYNAANVLTEALYAHVPNASYDTADYIYSASGQPVTLIETMGGTLGAGGALVFEQNYRADGTVASRLYGPSASYSLLEYDYNAAGSAQTLRNQTNLDGSHAISGLLDGVTLTSTAGVADTLTGGGAGETFVFGTAFGHDTVTDVGSHLSGLGADTLQFSASSFSYLSGGMTQAQEVAAIIANATQNASGAAVIADSAGDSVVLKGVSLSSLTANAGVIRVV